MSLIGHSLMIKTVQKFSPAPVDEFALRATGHATAILAIAKAKVSFDIDNGNDPVCSEPLGDHHSQDTAHGMADQSAGADFLEYRLKPRR